MTLVTNRSTPRGRCSKCPEDATCGDIIEALAELLTAWESGYRPVEGESDPLVWAKKAA